MELHEAIGAHYRSELRSWPALLGVDTGQLKSDLKGGLEAGAQGVVRLLPQRLKLDPRWIASGAAAGVLGCVAAATLLAPVAITALPLWTVTGAAIAWGIRAATSSGEDQAEEDRTPETQRAGAVRSAALFALLLELQGRDEAAITRILDEVVDRDGVVEIDSTPDARRWLDGIRHRFDLALAGEGVP